MKKYVLRAVTVVAFIAGLCLLMLGFDYILSDDTGSQSRITFHDFYEVGDVDVLFVGPSHSVSYVDATRLTDEWDCSVYSLCTKSQDIKTAYFVMKEALNTYDISHIYYEVSYSKLANTSVNATAAYIVTDYMRSPVIKSELILSSFSPDNYINSFFRARRNNDPLEFPTLGDINKLIKEKQEEKYTSYQGTSKYNGRGQWYLTGSIAEDPSNAVLDVSVSAIENYTIKTASDLGLKYLQKIVDLCAKKGVELTLYITPLSEYYMMSSEGIEDITKVVADFATANNVELIDFNLVKPEYLSLDLSDFKDYDHVTGESGYKLMDFLVEYEADSSKEYFLESPYDKYQINNKIKWVGFKRKFITSKGVYTSEAKAKGKIETVRITLFAIGYEDIPVNVRLFEAKWDADDETWRKKTEIEGVKIDEYSSSFEISYDAYCSKHYKVHLINPETDKIKYNCVTVFYEE